MKDLKQTIRAHSLEIQDKMQDLLCMLEISLDEMINDKEKSEEDYQKMEFIKRTFDSYDRIYEKIKSITPRRQDEEENS